MYFNEFWMTNLRKYEHIIYEKSDFMSQDWEKIINISRSTVPDCATFFVVPFLFDIEGNESSFKPKCINFQENRFQNT